MNNHLYITDWAPNGTHDLIITDAYGTIIDYMSEAVFGMNVNCTPDAACFYGESIGAKPQEYDFMSEDVSPVWAVTPAQARSALAVSPGSDGSAAQAFLDRHFS